MKYVQYASLLYCPRIVREVAAEKTEIAAVVVNAVTGMFIIAAVFLPMLSLYTESVVALVAFIFGPLVGFTVSSLYSRVDWTVGRRLGGKANLDELYRLFAWSFLLAGIAALLYSLIILTLKKPSSTSEIIASIPSLVIVCCAIRNYSSNIIFSQQFTKTRGAMSIVLAFVLFITLVAGGVGYLSLIFGYGK